MGKELGFFNIFIEDAPHDHGQSVVKYLKRIEACIFYVKTTQKVIRFSGL